jgi:hypothetical protein
VWQSTETVQYPGAGADGAVAAGVVTASVGAAVAADAAVVAAEEAVVPVRPDDVAADVADGETVADPADIGDEVDVPDGAAVAGAVVDVGDSVNVGDSVDVEHPAIGIDSNADTRTRYRTLWEKRPNLPFISIIPRFWTPCVPEPSPRP